MPDPQVPALRRGSEFLSSSLSGDEDSLSSSVLLPYRQDMALVESFGLDIPYSNVRSGHTHSMGSYLVLSLMPAFSLAPG